MEIPFWLFQRDEIDVLESELDVLWDRHMRPGDGRTEEEAVLKEYADTEDWAETDLLLRAGEPEVHVHEEDREAFDGMPAVDFLRQAADRDPLYVRAYEWARRSSAWAEGLPKAGAEALRAQVNALLVPVKLAFAQSGEAHEGRGARAAVLSDYALAVQYAARAAESFNRSGAHDLADEASGLLEAIAARRLAFEAGASGHP